MLNWFVFLNHFVWHDIEKKEFTLSVYPVKEKTNPIIAIVGSSQSKAKKEWWQRWWEVEC